MYPQRVHGHGLSFSRSSLDDENDLILILYLLRLLFLLLQAKTWVDENVRIHLLNRTTEVINYWQDEEKRPTLKEAQEKFPDCTFMGA